MKVIPTIIAGGSGSRLWPLSTPKKPKQFHSFTGGATLLEETINRIKSLQADFYTIITSHKYEQLSRKELSRSKVKGVVLSEPFPKNTAAAIFYGALFLQKVYKEAAMLILPADHYIKDQKKFVVTIKKGLIQVKKNKIVTIGIKPTAPETGYGYIQFQGKKEDKILEVKKFVEKPNLSKAREYLKKGNYLWNSGIFMWKVSVILDAFKKFLPEYFQAFQPLIKMSATEIKSNQSKIWEIKKEVFKKLPSLSIDYGILEKVADRVVIPASFSWNDLGSWQSLDGVLKANKNNNRTVHKNKALFVNSQNCSVFSSTKRISLLGLENVTVVQEGDEILILNKEQSQDVKKVVDLLD